MLAGKCKDVPYSKVQAPPLQQHGRKHFMEVINMSKKEGLSKSDAKWL